MAVRTGSPAPYGPPAGVMAVINGFRDRGLATPITSDVLVRAGISESLVPRVQKALEGLDLIDKDGNPTPQLIQLRTVKTDEFKDTLAEIVRAAYSEVFQFVNPATDDATRIADAFRGYEPAGQRGRMVTLFLGMCEAAGIIKPETSRLKAPSGNGRKAASATVRPSRPASVSPRAAVRVDSGGTIPPALMGLLASLPSDGAGWTAAQREKFVTAFGHVLDFTVPIISKPANDDDAE